MATDDESSRIRVAVAWSAGPGHAEEMTVQVPGGSTLGEVIVASGILERMPGLTLDTLKAGVWGKVRPLDAVIDAGDRVEVYRPLQIDPMEARRLRQRRQRDASGSRPR